MYIEPNSTVWLCKNIPFNNNYESTMYFETTVDQFAYFTSADKVVAKFEKQSYVRPTGALGGTIDVKELADNLYNVNYMVFQNTNFGYKWFYAFVTNVEYINNRTTRITFEIDVMQTWRVGYDYSLNESFVEREHSATDEIGDNLIDEGLELGEYYFHKLGRSAGFDSGYYPVVATTFDSIEVDESGNYSPTIADGDIYSNVYSGLKYKAFTYLSSLNTYLRKVTEANLSDGIISIFMLPSEFVASVDLKEMNTLETNIIINYNNLNGYIPKNNKLFCFPYNVLYVTDFSGNCANFAYEYFKPIETSEGERYCKFKTEIAVSPIPEAQLVPYGYKTIDNSYNYNERMVINNFPQCAYAIDSYRAWVAQNAVPMNISHGVGAIIGGITSAIDTATHGAQKTTVPNRGLKRSKRTVTRTYEAGVGDIVKSLFGGAISAVAPSIGDALAQRHIATTLPPQNRGSQTGVVNMASGLQGFTFYSAQIREEFAIIIDDYFQKYGYATKRVKVPNVNVREHWTYTKTIGCTISGALPADDESAICAIFDSGITFFKDEASFTQQSSLYNRPLSEVNASE